MIAPVRLSLDNLIVFNCLFISIWIKNVQGGLVKLFHTHNIKYYLKWHKDWLMFCPIEYNVSLLSIIYSHDNIFIYQWVKEILFTGNRKSVDSVKKLRVTAE